MALLGATLTSTVAPPAAHGATAAAKPAKKRCVAAKKKPAGAHNNKNNENKKSKKKKSTPATPRTSAKKKCRTRATPGATPTTNVTARGRTGKPGPDNTGHIPGTTQHTHHGDWYIDTPGATITNTDITGRLIIRAPRVTVRNSIIRGATTTSPGTNDASLLITSPPGKDYSGYLIEDVTITTTTPNPKRNGVNVNTGGTFNRLNIFGTVDGIMMFGAGNITVANSYLHDFTTYPHGHTDNGPTHNDAIQIQSGHGNRITANTLSGATNAAIMITQDAGTTGHLTIADNWLSGGACTINYASHGTPQTGHVVTGNHFAPTSCPVIANPTTTPLAATANTYDDTGASITIRRGQ